VEGKSLQQRGMEEAPENSKESSHSAHANGMSEWMWHIKSVVIEWSHCMLCYRELKLCGLKVKKNSVMWERRFFRNQPGWTWLFWTEILGVVLFQSVQAWWVVLEFRLPTKSDGFYFIFHSFFALPWKSTRVDTLNDSEYCIL